MDPTDDAFRNKIGRRRHVSHGAQESGGEGLRMNFSAKFDNPLRPGGIDNVNLGIGAAEILFHETEGRARRFGLASRSPGPIRDGFWFRLSPEDRSRLR